MSTVLHQALIASYGSGGSSPDELGDLQLWIDASQETGFSNGDEVSTAQDWSGNNRDATGAINNVLKPTYRATDGPNGLPAFRCQNNDTTEGGYFTLPDFLSGTAGHHFTILKLDIEPDTNSRSGPPLGDWGSATTTEFYGFPADGKIYSAWGSDTWRGTVDPAVALTNWHVYEERTAAGAWSNWIDAVQQFTTATNTVGWGAAPKIGHHGISGISTLYGMIAEVIFYNRTLTGDEILEVYAYLNDKYAFSL